MLHPPARRAIDWLLAGNGWGDGALAVAAAAALQDWALCPPGMRLRLLEAALAQAADSAGPVHHPCLQERPAPDARAATARLAGLAAASARDPGRAWAALGGLADCWPHATEDERAALRARLVSGLAALPERGGVEDRDLAAWSADTAPASSMVGAHLDLLRLVEDVDRLQAWRRLSCHLHRAEGLMPLIAALGGIAGQQLNLGEEPDEALWSVAVGAAACHRLAPDLDPACLAPATIRLALQCWWGVRHRTPASAALRSREPDLAKALHQGDRPAARRAARALARDAERFWDAVQPAADAQLAGRPGLVRHLAPLLAAARHRCPDGLVPDDAAAIASVLIPGSPVCQADRHCIALS